MENTRHVMLVRAACVFGGMALGAAVLFGFIHFGILNFGSDRLKTEAENGSQAYQENRSQESGGQAMPAVDGVLVANYVQLPSDIATAITWTRPEPLKKMGLVSTDIYYEGQDEADYSQIGTYTHDGVKNRVLLVEIPPSDIGPVDRFRVVEFEGKLVILAKYSDRYTTYFAPFPGEEARPIGEYLGYWNEATRSRLSIDKSSSVPALDFPDIYQLKNNRQILEKKESFTFFGPAIQPDPTESVIVTDPLHGPLYASTETGGFYFVTPDGFSVPYALKVDIVEREVLQLTWNDGQVNTDSYVYAERGGCGSVNFLSVVSPQEVNIARDLKVVGKTKQGDSIYELINAEHKILKDFYDTTYLPGRDADKISYAEFIKMHPLLFWVDPFGRLIKLSRSEFGSMAECGKPVIYLYPEKTTNVNVQVKPAGGLTYSDPEYKDGWRVVAEPTGNLTEVSSQKTYPYLFWEGRGGLYQAPKEGFVVKKQDVEQFLRDTLTRLGLNKQETADFMEFWLPRMQAKPYYFITFLGTREMNALAPLTINPKPDTIVRVLMDFTELDKPITVEPLRLGKTPQRKGFTVMEWGGVLR